MSKEKKAVLITGAAGFLGYALVRGLLHEEKNPICVVSDKSKLENYFSEVEVFDTNDLQKNVLPWQKVEGVIHSAFSRSTDGQLLAKSLKFTESFLNDAARNNVKWIVNISSQGVYGQKNTPPWTEDMNVAPEGMYALAKFSSEQIVKGISENSDLSNYTSIRLPGLTGGSKGLKPEIVSKFVSNVIGGESIKITGGKQVFSNMDVRDAADGIICLIGLSDKKWECVYNLGNKWRHSIVEIANIVNEVASEFNYSPVPVEVEEKDIHLNSGMDSSRFLKLTNWEPRFSMHDMIRSLFEYYTNPNGKQGK